MNGWISALVVLMLATACPQPTSSATSSGGDTRATETTGTTATDDPTPSGGASTHVDTSESGQDTGGGQGSMCDLFAQNCDEGLKCMYACDGPSCVPRCRPTVPDANSQGDSCVAAPPEAELPDDCDTQTLCWTGESSPGEGTCEPLCTGSAALPRCDDPDRVCALQSVCLRRCDPLLQDCPVAQGCFDVDVGTFVCWNIAPEPELDGEVCGGNTLCQPGSTCAFADTLPECPGRRCCTPLCDVEEGDADCAGTGAAVTCVPYTVEVPSSPSLGVCAVPS